MIIFVYFMSPENIYCKVNQICAKTVFLDEILPIAEKLSEFKLREKYGEAGIIYADQKELQKKAIAKLPGFVDKHCFFTRTSLEQATPEKVGKVKAQRHAIGKILSLCGGIGADEFCFSAHSNHITSIEISPCLNELVAFNSLFEPEKYLRITASAEEYLATHNAEQFDLVYLDPDRRVATGKKSYSAGNYAPDFIELYKQYGAIAPKWMVKLSPAIDLDWLEKNIPFKKDIEIYSLNGEIKEVLLVLGESTIGSTWVIECAEEIAFDFNTNAKCLPPYSLSDQLIFAEASALSIKSGHCKSWAEILDLEVLNANQTYFKGNVILPEALARTFLLEQILEGSFNEIKKELNKLKIDKAVISARNMGMPTSDIYRVLDLGEGDGKGYFLFFNKTSTKKTCFLTRQLN